MNNVHILHFAQWHTSTETQNMKALFVLEQRSQQKHWSYFGTQFKHRKKLRTGRIPIRLYIFCKIYRDGYTKLLFASIFFFFFFCKTSLENELQNNCHHFRAWEFMYGSPLRIVCDVRRNISGYWVSDASVDFSTHSSAAFSPTLVPKCHHLL